MDIHVGEQTIDYQSVAQKEKLTELQLRVRQLLAQVEQISKEQNYQRVIIQNLIFNSWMSFICVLYGRFERNVSG